MRVYARFQDEEPSPMTSVLLCVLATCCGCVGEGAPTTNPDARWVDLAGSYAFGIKECTSSVGGGCDAWLQNADAVGIAQQGVVPPVVSYGNSGTWFDSHAIVNGGESCLHVGQGTAVVEPIMRERDAYDLCAAAGGVEATVVVHRAEGGLNTWRLVLVPL